MNMGANANVANILNIANIGMKAEKDNKKNIIAWENQDNKVTVKCLVSQMIHLQTQKLGKDWFEGQVTTPEAS